MAPGGSFQAIFWHELSGLTGKPLWRISAAVLVAFLLLGSWGADARLRAESREHEHLQALYRSELQGLSVAAAAELLHPALKPPRRLSLLVDGGQVATPDVYRQKLNPWEVPALARTPSRNDRLPNVPPLDWLLAVRLLLSLLAFGLCFDRICGEWEAGTLKLQLSYPVPRRRILAGKFLAAWCCLAAPFLVGAAGGLAWQTRGGSWSAPDWLKVALLLLLVLWALALFMALALFVSCRVREPADSLSVLLLLWVLLVVVTPAVGSFLAQRLRPAMPQTEIDRRLRAAVEQVAHSYRGQDRRWRPPAEAARDGFSWERRSAEATARLFLLQESHRRRVLLEKLEQAELAERLSAASPAFLIQGAAERLAGTGIDRDRSFLAQAWRFRSRLGTALRRADSRDLQSPHILFFHTYMSQRPLPPAELPRFTFREATVLQGLAAALPWLLVLALESAALGAATLWAFERYDGGRTR